MAKMTKTRLDELFEAEIDYSMPINAFANKAKALFNKMAKAAGIKTRVYAAEYGDGSARLYMSCDDELTKLSGVLALFPFNVELLASENKKLTKLSLPVKSVTFHGDEIDVNF